MAPVSCMSKCILRYLVVRIIPGDMNNLQEVMSNRALRSVVYPRALHFATIPNL